MTNPVIRHTPRKLLALFAALFLALGIYAADPVLKAFDLPADTAENSLKRFSEQTGLEIIFATKVGREVRTHEVKGEMTPSQALDAMLADTGLKVIRDNKTGALTVRRENAEESKNVSRAIAQSSDRPTRSRRVTQNENGEDVVKLDTFEVFGQKTLNMDVKRGNNDILPYVIFDRKAIEASGATTLESFISKSVTAAGLRPDSSQVAVQSQNLGIRLRGLGPNETLILLDGRRMAERPSIGILGAGSFQPPDLNGIPLSAIDHIDILPGSASGIYGGSATGGVINIVLRRDYSGTEIKLTYGNTFDTDVNYRKVELNGGFTSLDGRTNFMYALTTSDGGSLMKQDRNFRDRYFALNRANLPNTDINSVDGTGIPLPTGTTTNIVSTSGANLTLKAQYGGGSLNSQITSVPNGYAGPLSDNGAGLIARAGQYNYGYTIEDGGGSTLRSTPAQSNYLFTFRREISPMLSVFVDVSGSRSRSSVPDVPTLFGLTLDPSDAGNPFNQPISVSFPQYGTIGQDEARQSSTRYSGGAIVKLPADWNIAIDYTRDETRSEYISAPILKLMGDTSSLAPAIAAGTLNIFRDLKSFPIDLTPYLFAIRQEGDPAKSHGDTMAMRSSGPLSIRSNWQPIQISASIQYADQAMEGMRLVSPQYFSSAINRYYVAPADQTVRSAYLEANWPLITAARQIPLVDRLEVFAAVRHDDYSFRTSNPVLLQNLDAAYTLSAINRSTIKLNATKPIYGILYRPTKDLSVRVSYAEGFVPPMLTQFIPSAPRTTTAYRTLNIRDPLRGNELLGSVTRQSGGNSGLQPETTESWSSGVIVTPRGVNGLRLSADWSRIEKADVIGSPPINNQATFNEFLTTFPNRITRSAPSDGYAVGKIIGVDISLANFSKLVIDAADFAIDYDMPVENIGTFTFSGKATRNYHFIQQATPTAPEREGVESFGFIGYIPKWRAVGSICWQREGWTVGFSTQYVSRLYFNAAKTVDPILKTDHLPAEVYHDVFVKYAFGSGARSKLFRDVEIAVNINNVFNTQPAITASSPYIDDGSGIDTRLANYLVTLRKKF